MRAAPYPNPTNTWDGGVLLPGWHCRAEGCGAFNGEPIREVNGTATTQTRTECRSCGRPRGWQLVPDADDPGTHACKPFLLWPERVNQKHEWSKDGKGVCTTCGARAIRGHFGDETRGRETARP